MRRFAYDHPKIAVAGVMVVLVVVGSFVPTVNVFANEVSMTAGALSNIKLLAHATGFGAGCAAGFGFAMAWVMPMYENKAGKWDAFAEQAVQAHIGDIVAPGQNHPHDGDVPVTEQTRQSLEGPVRAVDVNGREFSCFVFDRVRFTYHRRTLFGAFVRRQWPGSLMR